MIPTIHWKLSNKKLHYHIKYIFLVLNSFSEYLVKLLNTWLPHRLLTFTWFATKTQTNGWRNGHKHLFIQMKDFFFKFSLLFRPFVCPGWYWIMIPSQTKHHFSLLPRRQICLLTLYKMNILIFSYFHPQLNIFKHILMNKYDIYITQGFYSYNISWLKVKSQLSVSTSVLYPVSCICKIHLYQSKVSKLGLETLARNRNSVEWNESCLVNI